MNKEMDPREHARNLMLEDEDEFDVVPDKRMKKKKKEKQIPVDKKERKNVLESIGPNVLIQFHKIKSNGQKAFINEYTSDRLGEEKSVEGFVTKYLIPEHGYGKYILSVETSRGIFEERKSYDMEQPANRDFYGNLKEEKERLMEMEKTQERMERMQREFERQKEEERQRYETEKKKEKNEIVQMMEMNSKQNSEMLKMLFGTMNKKNNESENSMMPMMMQMMMQQQQQSQQQMMRAMFEKKEESSVNDTIEQFAGSISKVLTELNEKIDGVSSPEKDMRLPEPEPPKPDSSVEIMKLILPILQKQGEEDRSDVLEKLIGFAPIIKDLASEFIRGLNSKIERLENKISNEPGQKENLVGQLREFQEIMDFVSKNIPQGKNQEGSGSSLETIERLIDKFAPVFIQMTENAAPPPKKQIEPPQTKKEQPDMLDYLNNIGSMSDDEVLELAKHYLKISLTDKKYRNAILPLTKDLDRFAKLMPTFFGKILDDATKLTHDDKRRAIRLIEEHGRRIAHEVLSEVGIPHDSGSDDNDNVVDAGFEEEKQHVQVQPGSESVNRRDTNRTRKAKKNGTTSKKRRKKS